MVGYYDTILVDCWWFWLICVCDYWLCCGAFVAGGIVCFGIMILIQF